MRALSYLAPDVACFMRWLMDKPEEVPKRTSWGSGPHKRRALEEQKGIIPDRKHKHKKKPEDQNA